VPRLVILWIAGRFPVRGTGRASRAGVTSSLRDVFQGTAEGAPENAAGARSSTEQNFAEESRERTPTDSGGRTRSTWAMTADQGTLWVCESVYGLANHVAEAELVAIRYVELRRMAGHIGDGGRLESSWGPRVVEVAESSARASFDGP
jgi:hypothetical protein